MDVLAEVAQLGAEVLTGVARRALHSETAEVAEWICAPLTYASTPLATLWSDGVYRVTGTATDAGREAPWGAVLKTYHTPADRPLPDGTTVAREHADDEGTSHYWKREALAYASGLLEDLPGGIAAPRCLGVTELPEEHCWVWLEDVGDPDGGEWPLERYRLAAVHLGQFNGAYLAARSLPDFAWLNRRGLRGFMAVPLEFLFTHIGSIDGAWGQPVVRQAFSPELVARVLRLWEQRGLFLSALERLPQVFSHLDAFRGNLFGRALPDGGEETVAIDWAFAGIAPLGEELAPLIVGSVVTDHVPLEELARLEGMALEGYIEGLREAGWDGPQELVRASYAACAALRYGLINAVQIILGASNEDRRIALTEGRACSFEQLAHERAALTLHMMDNLDRARPILGLS